MTCRSCTARKKCRNCQLVRYCNEIHQHQDWDQHKPLCKWLRAFLENHFDCPLSTEGTPTITIRKLLLDASHAWWSKKADEGDAEAIFLYGHSLLLKGNEHSVSDEVFRITSEAALAAFSKATDLGHVHAPHSQGQCLLFVCGLSADTQKKAYECFLKAAARGSRLGHFAVGLCLQKGDGVQQNVSMAVASYERVIIIRDIESKLFEPDASLFPSVVDPLRGEALARLGMCYANGVGNVKKDLNKAAAYFRLSCSENNTLGQFMFGTCYVNGAGVEHDVNKAVHLLGVAARKGHSGAQNLLDQIIGTYGDIRKEKK